MTTPVSLCGTVQGAKEVCKCFPPGMQQLLVPALIALFASIAEVNVDCPTLTGLAQQYACIPANLQLPALLYLAVQIVNNGGGGGTQNPVQVFNTAGTPNFSPMASIALAFDTTTIPGQPAGWVWFNSTWTQFLG